MDATEFMVRLLPLVEKRYSSMSTLLLGDHSQRGYIQAAHFLRSEYFRRISRGVLASFVDTPSFVVVLDAVDTNRESYLETRLIAQGQTQGSARYVVKLYPNNHIDSRPRFIKEPPPAIAAILRLHS